MITSSAIELLERAIEEESNELLELAYEAGLHVNDITTVQTGYANIALIVRPTLLVICASRVLKRHDIRLDA